VVVRRLSTRKRLVWVVTHELPNGDGLGPVALVDRTEDDVDVRAMGVLRSRKQFVRLRLRSMGKRQVLVAEGERCHNPNVPSTCIRAAQFLLRDGDRFNHAELRHVGGRCLGWASLEYARHKRIVLENGWRRDFNFASSYEVKGTSIAIHEQIEATDHDISHPDVPPRPFRSAEAEARWYSVRSSYFVTRAETLWPRMLLEDGWTHVESSQEEAASR
jgi:hypothetical protein